MKTKAILLLSAAGIFCILSGCRFIALPGREPFGEETYSNSRALAVYESVCGKMGRVAFSDWSGYAIQLNENTVGHDFYRTGEYTAAWHSGGGKKYLWYQGRLYCSGGETLACRDMDWEELPADEYAAQQWELALALLEQEPESLEYKYIPMSSGDQYLLTAEYPQLEYAGQLRQFPKLFFRMDGGGDFDGFTLRWKEGDWRVIDVSYFPYEGSTSLQAERKIWSYANELGLLEQGVPALSAQGDDREWCRTVISGIDFDSLFGRAQYQEDLTFPVPPERGEPTVFAQSGS